MKETTETDRERERGREGINGRNSFFFGGWGKELYVVHC